jgi:hypothetical protein
VRDTHSQRSPELTRSPWLPDKLYHYRRMALQAWQASTVRMHRHLAGILLLMEKGAILREVA